MSSIATTGAGKADITPGGSVDVLTDDDALSALTDDDGTYLRDD